MTQEHTPLQNEVLKTIHSGEVAMRSKHHFTLKFTALVLVSLVALVTSAFIFNFILFSIRISSQEALLGFGTQGIWAFFRFFPWYLLVINILSIGILEWLLRQFRFGYRTPVLYLLGALLILAAGLGFAVDRGTPFNDRLLEHSPRLPRPIGQFYEGARRPPTRGSGICRCTIVSIEDNTLIVEDLRGSTTTLTVVVPTNNPRATTTHLNVGDIILIAGDEEGGIMHAFGIQRLRTETKN